MNLKDFDQDYLEAKKEKQKDLIEKFKNSRKESCEIDAHGNVVRIKDTV